MVCILDVNNNLADTDVNRSSGDVVLEKNVKDTMDSDIDKYRGDGTSGTNKVVGQ